MRQGVLVSKHARAESATTQTYAYPALGVSMLSSTHSGDCSKVVPNADPEAKEKMTRVCCNCFEEHAVEVSEEQSRYACWVTVSAADGYWSLTTAAAYSSEAATAPAEMDPCTGVRKALDFGTVAVKEEAKSALVEQPYTSDTTIGDLPDAAFLQACAFLSSEDLLSCLAVNRGIRQRLCGVMAVRAVWRPVSQREGGSLIG